MPEQTRTEKIKYGLLKAIDVSGFKVLDPVIRLFFGEEPKKQINDIGRFMVMPMIFVLCCLVAWNFIAPRHKTKAGEVPTPAQVWDSFVVNNTLHVRENEKESDFAVAAKTREQRIEEITAEAEEKEKEVAELKASLAKVESKTKETQQAEIEPLDAKRKEVKATNKLARDGRKEEAKKLAESIAAKSANPDDLLAFLRSDSAMKQKEKDAEKVIKDKIDAIRAI